MLTAHEIPEIIQGGMGVAVSSWRLAGAVAQSGQLGVVSGTALDLVLARRLQDGDKGGHVRRALHHFPDEDVADRALARYFLEGGRAAGESYAPILKMTLTPNRSSQELLILGGFVETWLAKEGHNGLIGINCLEKIQLSTPGTLYGAMLAGVDVVLMGAGVPRAIPHLLDTLAAHGSVQFPIDVTDAGDVDYALDFEPRDLIDSVSEPLSRPVFLAIVSAHVLATYLARDPEIRPDGFIVEASSAGGHNAPPRQQLLDDRGDLVFGPRDEPDLQKIAKAGLPYWTAGGSGTPEMLAAAREAGARGIQVGTVFALCSDSGLDPEIRARLLEGIARDELVVHTDPVASPTGFPFKVVDVSGHDVGRCRLRVARTTVRPRIPPHALRQGRWLDRLPMRGRTGTHVCAQGRNGGRDRRPQVPVQWSCRGRRHGSATQNRLPGTADRDPRLRSPRSATDDRSSPGRLDSG